MKRRLLSLVLIMVIIIGATAPCFAAPTEVYNNTWSQRFTSIVNYLANFDTNWLSWTTLDHNGNSVSTAYTFAELANDVRELCYWLTPNDASAVISTGLGLWDYVWYLAQQVGNLWGGWDSYFSNLTTLPTATGYLNNLKQALTNYDYRYYNRALTTQEASIYAHRSLFGSTTDYPITPWYSMPTVNASGVVSASSQNWFYGTPIGNLVLLTLQSMKNNVNEYSTRWDADLKHYSDNLTTWASDTLTQVNFTPESMTQGLYRYLAYLQYDTAHTYNHMLTGFNNAIGLTNRETGVSANVTPVSLAGGLYSFLDAIEDDISISYYRGIRGFDTTLTLRSRDTLANTNYVPYSAIDGTYKYLDAMEDDISYLYAHGLTGFNNPISYLNGNNMQVGGYITGVSATDAILKWMQMIEYEIAPLHYVLADETQVETKANAIASGVEDIEPDLYDPNSGGVTFSDMSNAFSTGTSARNVFDTGVSYSTNGLFSFTDNGNWGFWSNDAKNDMDTVASTRDLRKNNQFDTSAYDDRLESLESIWGLDNNGK